jgi:DNA-binding IscR family transcriptional regulator
MKHQRLVQFAVMCLQALEVNAGTALSASEISQRQGVPLPDCIHILHQFNNAGIVQSAASGKVALTRPVADFTALEILEALWACETPPAELRMLIGGQHGKRFRMTRDWVQRASAGGCEING